MPLCPKCRQREATRHFVHRVDGEQRANLHLCEECARPVEARLEAKRQGQHKCEFCGRAAFNPLPGALAVIYACCQCRAEFARIFFDLCARQFPELLERSKKDIFFFEMIGEAEVEARADAISQEAIGQLRKGSPDDSTKPS